MSDSTAFIAGCATTGAAALMLLLARMSIDESSPRLRDTEPVTRAEVVTPVPLPPPPDFQSSSEDTQELKQALEQQQETTDRLEDRLHQQRQLIANLEDQILDQAQEARDLSARLEDYYQATEDLSERQVRLEGDQRYTDEAQNSLVWVGAGLLLVLLAGGGGIVIVLILWVAQSRSQPAAPTNTVIYSPPPPPAYPYYDHEPDMLPPTPLRPADLQPIQPQYHQ